MGIQNDHLLKLIAEISNLFAAIASGESSPSQKIENIDTALSATLNVDPMFLFSGLAEELHTIDPRAAIFVAQLLALRVEALENLDRCYESSLITAIDFANKARQGDSQSRKKGLKILSDFIIRVTDTAVLETLIHIFEEEHRFGSAEDAIFKLIHANHEFLQIGLDFYDRIQLLDDLTLQNGGLPRTEILEAISELHNLA